MGTSTTGPDLRRTARRIGVQTAALLIACLVVVGTIVYATVARSQNEQILRNLNDAATAAWQGRETDHDRDSATTTAVPTAKLTEHGLISPAGLPAGLPDVDVMHAVQQSGVADQRRVYVASRHYALLTAPHGGDVVQAIYNLRELDEERKRILMALALASAVGVILAAAAGAWLARRAVQPMADALELQRRFVADASHELRTPLTLLSTRAQLLRRRLGVDHDHRETNRPGSVATVATAAVARDVDGIVADAKTLTEILEDLLLAADTRETLPQQPVDLAALAAAAVASAGAEAESHHVQLELCHRGDLVLQAGSTAGLTRALTALIDNAISHAQSSVLVDLSRSGSQVLVSVRDDGPGLPAEAVPRMFTRFVSDRADQASHQGRRHYGLGLALVKEIAVRHGGQVTAHNRTDAPRGADVRLSLPVGVSQSAGHGTGR